MVIDKTFSKFRNVGAGRSPGGREGKSLMGAEICLSEAGSDPSIMEGGLRLVPLRSGAILGSQCLSPAGRLDIQPCQEPDQCW